MEKNHYQALLRILYQHKTDSILVYQNGAVLGLVHKHHLEELMSDLSQARSGFDLPITPAEMDDVLNAISRSGAVEKEARAIPVIDRDCRLIGLWSKTDFIKASSGNREKFNEPEEPREEPQNQLSNNKVGDAIAPEAPEPAGEATKSGALNSADFISIKTLESLPIPMLALDTRGEVLFYNQDWVSIQKANRETLGIKKIMTTAKDLMAKLAFEGDLEIDSILELPVPLEGFAIKMRAILDDSADRKNVIGYIFWVELIRKEIVEKIVTHEIPAKEKEIRKKKPPSTGSGEEDPTSRYMGRTLVEILREEEKKVLSWALNEADGNQSNAAMLLGIPRQTFSFRYRRIFSNKMSNKLK